MTLETSDTPQGGNLQAATKKARPNPGRRKASRLKDASGDTNTAQHLINSESRPSIPDFKPATSTAKARPADQSTPHAPPIRQNGKPSSKQKKPPRKIELRHASETSKPNDDTSDALSTAQPSSSNALALAGPALTTGGLLGCAASAAVLLGVHLWYDFSGAEQAILAAKSARLCVDNFTDELIASQKAGTYSADEALDMLRRTTLAYGVGIPGGAPFIERIFREVDLVRKLRGREVDAVLAATHLELTQASNRGATPTELRDVVLANLMKLSTFASNGVQDVVSRNPQLRPYQRGAMKSLQGASGPDTPTMRVNMVVRQK